MADTWVTGGRLDNDTTIHDLYTAAADAIVEVCINNQSATAVGVDLTHAPAGAADVAAHYKLGSSGGAGFSVPANDSFIYPRPIKMKATDKLRVRAHTANVVSFTYDGIET
jgi:kynurenine formamidase